MASKIKRPRKQIAKKIFFHALGDLFMTGPTGTNVMDLIVALVE